MSHKNNDQFIENVNQCAQEFEFIGDKAQLQDIIEMAKENGYSLKPCQHCKYFNCECNDNFGEHPDRSVLSTWSFN